MNAILYLLTFLLALPCGMGIGSGGLFLLALVELFGVSQYEAQGMNLLFFIGASLASVFFHGQMGRLPIKGWLLFLAVGLLGAVLGSLLTLVLSPEVARKAFGLLMVLGSLYTLKTWKIGKKAPAARKFP